MLWTYLLAFSKFDAIGHLAVLHGVDFVVVIGIPVVGRLLGVHEGSRLGMEIYVRKISSISIGLLVSTFITNL